MEQNLIQRLLGPEDIANRFASINLVEVRIRFVKFRLSVTRYGVLKVLRYANGYFKGLRCIDRNRSANLSHRNGLSPGAKFHHQLASLGEFRMRLNSLMGEKVRRCPKSRP